MQRDAKINMKVNDRKELHSKSVEELEKLLKESYNTLLQIKLDNEQNKLKNTRSMTFTRKEIAVMKTILNEKLKAARSTTLPASKQGSGQTKAEAKEVKTASSK